MWSHLLYIAFKGDASAVQWSCFCVSLSGRLLNILQLFASFSQNPKLPQWGDGINYTGDLPRYVLVRLFDNLTDKSFSYKVAGNAVLSGHSAAGL